MGAPSAAYLDGDARGRLHLHHGPIDLVIGVDPRPGFSEDPIRARAFEAAHARFGTLLAELVAELAVLKAPARPGSRAPAGRVARRMAAAVAPYSREVFITPMAAVAGAVADEILGAMLAAFGDDDRPERIYVNNGGDIALHLRPGAAFSVGVAREDGTGYGRLAVTADQPTRGIATSGRGGRSLSMGIADSVTVLAASGAAADAAATVIGNAVDLPGHPGVARRPANAVVDDSDLGDRPVVIGVGALTDTEIAAALDAGEAAARRLMARGLVHRAALFLGRHGRVAAPTVPQTSNPITEVPSHA